jgi:hypothetical protein
MHMRKKGQAAAAGVVVLALGCLVLGSWQRNTVASELLWRPTAGSALYYTGSSNGGAGYYADLVSNPRETPAEFLAKQEAARAADEEQVAEAAVARNARAQGLIWRQMQSGSARTMPGKKSEPEATWEPISEQEGRYYEDLIDNPGETFQDFLQKEQGSQQQASAAASPDRTRMQGLRASDDFTVSPEFEDEAAGGVDKMLNLMSLPSFQDVRTLQGAASSAAAAKDTRVQLQGLREVDPDADPDVKQMFYVPDLEQETDGLDLMQDYAPRSSRAHASATTTSLSKATPERESSRKSKEGYAMHSLRSAFEAKTTKQILAQV